MSLEPDPFDRTPLIAVASGFDARTNAGLMEKVVEVKQNAAGLSGPDPASKPIPRNERSAKAAASGNVLQDYKENKQGVQKQGMDNVAAVPRKAGENGVTQKSLEQSVIQNTASSIPDNIRVKLDELNKDNKKD